VAFGAGRIQHPATTCKQGRKRRRFIAAQYKWDGRLHGYALWQVPICGKRMEPNGVWVVLRTKT